jgi:superfamily II DNA or RNA helicase
VTLSVQLRQDDQQPLVDAVQAHWAAGARGVLMRADTGFGKTVCLSYLVDQHGGASCIMAHRQELVMQLSLTLARYGVRHDLIASAATCRAIARAHVEELGACYYQPGARCRVASVDTIIRAQGLEAWAQQVTLVVPDEGHHVVRGNKWSKAIDLFTHPALRILLPTATPLRADGKGLGTHADGYADVMVEAPPMRWCIERGYLTDYRIVCPPSDLVVLGDPGASGDWSPEQLREAARKSHIVGDVVQHYQKWATGRLGVTFCTDVETAIDTTAAFRAAGVNAETLTGKTPDHVRRDILRRYRAREVMQLVTVDIVSEGFDLPAIEVASMARPTQSLALYMQQFGRALRPMAGKDRALIIDHVSNVVRHNGPPDRPRVWSLDRRERRAKTDPDAIPIRICLNTGCFQPYERYYRRCPHCGYYPEPAGRSLPEQVDGDLAELSAEALERLRGGIVDVDLSPADYAMNQARTTGLPQYAIATNAPRYERKVEAQRTLRATMAIWGGAQLAAGLTDEQMQRRFFLSYGIDCLSAQGLGATDAYALTERIDGTVNRG